jgi:hypothetical protein
LQDYVPFKKVKKNKRLKVLPIFTFLVIFVLSCALIYLVPLQKANQIFNTKTYYLVGLYKSRKKNDAISQKSQVELLGGAGYIFEKNDVFYLISSAYIKKEDASEISSSMSKLYSGAEVVAISSKSSTKQKQIKIRQNEKVLSFCKYIDTFIDFYLDYELQYLAGKVSDSELSKTLISKKLEIEEKIKQFDASVELENNAKIVANLILVHIDNFFSNFFELSKKNSTVCLLGVNLAIERVYFFDNL